MSHIFISYSKQNIHFARYLRKLFENEGFAVWMDETRLVPSQKWWPTIERNIESCAAFIVIMSPQAKESVWVEREILLAEDLKKPIFPVLFGGRRWSRLADIQYADMTAGEEAVLSDHLLNGLQPLVPRHSPQPPPPQLPGELIPDSSTSLPVLPSPSASKRPSLSRYSLVGGGLLAVVVVVIALLSSLNNPASDSQTPVATSASTDSAVLPADLSTIDVAASIAARQTASALQTLAAIPTTTPTPTTDFEATISAVLTATAAYIPLGYPGGAPITANSQWKEVRQSFDGVDMLLVPIGCFDMGSGDGESDEQPVNNQCIDQPFWIDRTEVTNTQFAQFNGVAANDSNWTDPNRPRESITWFEARDFCALRGARLPTEAEWEYAVRGPDDLKYPWGNDFVADNVVYSENSNNQTADVGSRSGGESWVGALDMSGNVWEWVSSIYQDYPYDPTDGREENSDSTDVLRGVRGGSFNYKSVNLRPASRYRLDPYDVYNDFGLRCVAAPIS